jgi:hypothetical protein
VRKDANVSSNDCGSLGYLVPLGSVPGMRAIKSLLS